MEWIKDQIEWLDSVSKESASRLAEKYALDRNGWPRGYGGKRNGPKTGHGK